MFLTLEPIISLFVQNIKKKISCILKKVAILYEFDAKSNFIQVIA